MQGFYVLPVHVCFSKGTTVSALAPDGLRAEIPDQGLFAHFRTTIQSSAAPTVKRGKEVSGGVSSEETWLL